MLPVMTTLKKIGIALVACLGIGISAQAQEARQIPAEVESEAQDIEARFRSTLKQECPEELCTPVGCKVTSFRTLDEQQNSSLPGIDVGDEPAVTLQHKLSALRCEFTFEPSLSETAVASLRQRLGDKVRLPGLSLLISGRKLSAASPLLQQVQKKGPESPLAPPRTSYQALVDVLPQLLLIIFATGALLILIWAFRRLGKPRPVVAAAENSEPTKTDVSPEENTVPQPSGFELLNKKEHLSEVFEQNPEVAQAALDPLIQKGNVEEICLFLKNFGPKLLASYSQQAQHRELFAAVHQSYSEKSLSEDPGKLMQFFEKLERLLALAQLARPEIPVDVELGFLNDLGPDEFAQLTASFDTEELLALLSFVPSRIRNDYLQKRDPRFAEAFLQYVLKNPRLPEHLLRRLSVQLQEQYAARRSEIRKVQVDQRSQVEQLLNGLSPEHRRQLYTSLRRDDPALFDQLSSEVLLDRALVHVPESVLNDVFLTLGPEESAAFLQQHPDASEILQKLRSPLPQAIRNHFSLPPNKGLDFLEDAGSSQQASRQKINQIMKEKSAKGEINLRKINESALGPI